MIQTTLFPDAPAKTEHPMPEGFRYQPELIDAHEEKILAAAIAAMSLKPYQFRGFYANRNVIAFGFRYNYDSRRLERTADLPPLIKNLRAKVASFSGKPAEAFQQVLITEYVPGTALGWHRDRLQYGEIAGVSLLSAAKFRVRRHEGSRWMRASRIIEPRSVYIMADEVRLAWEHSIPAADVPRYSLTFRTLADSFIAPNP
jgi:alkylated DNA repair dioxygenase AlkB